MFYTSKEKKKIYEALDYLSAELDKMSKRIATIEARHVLDEVAPYGFKKDGTPCKKPGRKAK